MTKRVELGTIEHGLRQAFAHLGIDGAVDAIEHATGNRKSASLLRKYADPDSPRHHIPMRDAMAIDLACLESGYKPPLLTAYQTFVDGDVQESGEPPTNPTLCCLALATGAAAGMVAEAVLQSEECKSCDCANNHDREAIYSALVELEAVVGTLRKAVLTLDKTGRFSPVK